MLLSVGVGEGLFFAGQSHVVVKIVASPFEKELATTNPADRLIPAPQEAPLPQINPSEIPPQPDPTVFTSQQTPPPLSVPTNQNNPSISNKPEPEIF